MPTPTRDEENKRDLALLEEFNKVISTWNEVQKTPYFISIYWLAKLNQVASDMREKTIKDCMKAMEEVNHEGTFLIRQEVFEIIRKFLALTKKNE